MSQPMFYYETGHTNQKYPIVFIHGFCESSSIWRSLSDELAADFRILCPDLPGFGKSPLPKNNFSLEQIADQIVSWLHGLDIKNCILIGHSLGGYISLEILRKYPDFIKAIGLLNSSAFEDADEKKENRNKLIEFIRSNGVDPFIKTFVPSLFYPKTISKHLDTIKMIDDESKSINSASVMKYAAAMRDRKDSMDLLKKYHDRVLLISGEFDQNVPLKKSKKMAQIINKENSYIIPDSAHMSIFEQSNLCYAAIRNFVNSFQPNDKINP